MPIGRACTNAVTSTGWRKNRMPKKPSLDDSIERLPLTSRACKALSRRGILTIGELMALSDDELLMLPNFGRRSLDNVYTVTKRFGRRRKHPKRGESHE